MADSLKKANKLALVGLLAANVVVFYGVVQNDAIITGSWSAISSQLSKAVPAALCLALIGILNGQLSADAKARIVFMRWRNALPGCQAFTRYAKADPRVDLASIERTHGPLPTEPREQNALWYRLYKSVDTEPSIIQVHREFLFARDYTGMALLILIGLGTAGFVQIPSTGTALIYLGVLLVQFILAGQAARNHGRRFVTTVLALRAVRDQE